MVERFLTEIFRRTRRNEVAILIATDVLTDAMLESLGKLRQKVMQQVGEIRVSEVLSDRPLPEEQFSKLREIGYTNKTITTHFDLTFLLEVYDLVLTQEVNFLILGTKSEDLIPLYGEIKKKVGLYAYLDDNNISDALRMSFDDIIYVSELDDFEFSTANIETIESMIQEQNGSKMVQYRQMRGINIDALNIGAVSEYLENKDL